MSSLSLYIQGAHASPPTPLHEKEIAITYGIRTVMLSIIEFSGCDCCCSAQALLCSVSWKCACAFPWVIVKATLLVQWVLYLPVGCFGNSQFSEGEYPMGFDRRSDNVALLCWTVALLCFYTWSDHVKLLSWRVGLRYVLYSNVHIELWTTRCELSSVSCKLV